MRTGWVGPAVELWDTVAAFDARPVPTPFSGFVIPTIKPPVRVALLFLVYLGVLHGIYQFERRTTNRYLERPLTHAVTVASGYLAAVLLPFPVEQRGVSVLASEGTAVLVAAGCNGVEALFLILAGVLAVPAAWAVRGRALACYLPLLFFLNLLRVDGLLYVLVRFPEHISLAHDQIAQGIMVVAVFLLWLRYLGRVTPAR